jgi:hypothetical protein
MNYYKPIDYFEFYWIINKANIKHLKKYYTCVISYDFLRLYDECEFVPATFNADWCVNYDITTENKIRFKKDKPVILGYDYSNDYSAYISCNACKDLDYAINAYKLYGKKIFIVKNCIFKVLHFFKNIFLWKTKEKKDET